MKRKILSAALAGAAVLCAGPALAGPGGGGGGQGHGGGVSTTSGARGGMGGAHGTGAGMSGTIRGNSGMDVSGGVATRINSPPTTNPAIGVSQGPLHASPTGIAHANERSVLAGGSVASSTLPGLTTGLSVTNANGTNIGTISQIITDNSGNIRLVIVTSSTGQTFRLIPTTLTINGTAVTTTSTVGG